MSAALKRPSGLGTGVIDWEDVADGPLAHDLGIAVLGCCYKPGAEVPSFTALSLPFTAFRCPFTAFHRGPADADRAVHGAQVGECAAFHAANTDYI